MKLFERMTRQAVNFGSLYVYLTHSALELLWIQVWRVFLKNQSHRPICQMVCLTLGPLHASRHSESWHCARTDRLCHSRRCGCAWRRRRSWRLWGESPRRPGPQRRPRRLRWPRRQRWAPARQRRPPRRWRRGVQRWRRRPEIPAVLKGPERVTGPGYEHRRLKPQFCHLWPPC